MCFFLLLYVLFMDILSYDGQDAIYFYQNGHVVHI